MGVLTFLTFSPGVLTFSDFFPLDKAGILTRTRHGRRNIYSINMRAHLRHPIEESCTVGQLLTLFLSPARVRSLKTNKEAFEEQFGNQKP